MHLMRLTPVYTGTPIFVSADKVALFYATETGTHVAVLGDADGVLVSESVDVVRGMMECRTTTSTNYIGYTAPPKP
jgi:hypothetical protein